MPILLRPSAGFKGVAADFIDYLCGFWRYRYCRSIGRNAAKALTLTGFQTEDYPARCTTVWPRLPLISNGNLGSSLPTLWLSGYTGSSPHLRPRDQLDLFSAPLPVPDVPLGRTLKISDTGRWRCIEGGPVEAEP